MIFGILWILASVFAFGGIEQYEMASLPHMSPLKKIKLLDQKSIDISYVDNIKFAEISDLGYDTRSKKLYMLSDKGRLFVFDTKLGDKNISLNPTEGYHLRKKSGKKLKHKKRDSEGMTFDNKGDLWISLEGRPRIARIDKSGKILEYATLPKTIPPYKKLRGSNKGLESLTWHPEYGLVTALEYPQQGTPLSHQTLYALSGKSWEFVIDDIPHPGVTAIETMDDGNILVLVRTLDKKHFRAIIALIKVYLDKQDKNGLQHTEVLAKLSTDDGWSVDNFEGLVRVAPHRYLMVSDNGSLIPRSTLLIYFEVKQEHLKPKSYIPSP